MNVARGAAYSLDQRPLGSQEAFLVGVQYCDERHLGHVQAFPQQVNADQYIEGAETQVADDLGALNGADVGMQVAHPYIVFLQVVRQVLGHTFGQGGYQHAFVNRHPFVNLGEHIVDLGLGRSNLHARIHEPRGSYQLFHGVIGSFDLEVTGRCRHVDSLRRQALEFVEPQRPIVQRRRQAKAKFDQCLLAGTIAFVHATELRHRDMTFIDDQHCILGHVVEQTWRWLAHLAARQVARVILDPGAVAQLLDHLQIK